MVKLVIDTDTAGDDVTSLLFGLRWPGVELEAITVVRGTSTSISAWRTRSIHVR
jgi:inosine-uridine nucleoside N-ribohydrolase